MTLEEARSTYWFKNYHRPMGELVDSGFLDIPRLEWAIQKSYVTAIKEAALVILEQIKNQPVKIAEPFVVDINEDAARKVIWPFSDQKGRTLGELWDNGILSLKDLGYAVERAYDHQVRMASAFFAVILLRQQLAKPTESKGALKVEGRPRFLEKVRETISFKQGALLGLSIGIYIAILIYLIASGYIKNSILSSINFDWNWITLIVVIVSSIPSIAIIWWVSTLIDKKIDRWDLEKEHYLKGQEGEDRVIDSMRDNLDGTWRLYRNLVLPTHKQADIDLVLVGPYGVWVFEVKNYSGEYRNIKGDWLIRLGKRWISQKTNPSKQARHNAMNLAQDLSALFEKYSIRKWVMPVVIMANPNVTIELHSEETQVWKIQRLADELGNLHGTTLPEPLQQEIRDRLSQLIVTKTEMT